MNTDEASIRIAKYGMPAEYADCIVQRHFDVTDEHERIAAGVLDHNLRFACMATALLNGEPAPAPPAPSIQTPEPVVPVNVEPENLRGLLGLS
jgi:hypothetical protein